MNVARLGHVPSDQQRLHSTNDYLPPLERERGRSHSALLEGVKGQPAVVPTEEASFPGEEPTAWEAFESDREEPRFPSALPQVWNVPYLWNRTFTGREDLLEELAASLGAGTATAITQAIAGLGGWQDEPGGEVCLPAAGRPAGY